MPFKEERSDVSNTFDTYNDVQRDQYNVVIYQSHISGTPQQTPSLLDTTLRYLHKHVLPSPPELMIGRDEEKADVIHTLLQKSPARVAILGGAGIGKTTLALSILHEDAITEHYPSRYFVSCEGVPSVSSLIEEIANALRVPLAKRDAFLIDTIFSSFPEKTLLCLDNFETLWDDEAIRPEIEEFLSSLQHRVLGLIITMRGAQRPSRVSWSKPFLSPLQPLTKDSSRLLFARLAGDSDDEFAEKLLDAVDGIPLAISLICALLQEGFESSESLWRRWETQSGVLEHGGKHRLSNLDTSIHLSVHGPRMREDPTTIDILAMLSVLPDGLPDDETVVEELQRHLPEAYHLQKALLTMRRVSLVQVVQVDGAAVRRRLRMLSPIQSFCQKTLEGSEELRNGITSFYVEKIGHFANFTSPAGHAIIPNELHNVHAVLMQAWKRGKGNPTIAVASIRFTSWSMYVGNPVEEVVRAAMEGVVGQRNLQGDCHGMIGEVQLRLSKLGDAEASLKLAAELHRQMGNIIGEGNDLQSLGEVYLRRSKLNEAEASLGHAAELYQQAHNALGEGNSFQSLGEVHLRRHKLDEAEASLKRAAELHQQVHDILGEGNDLFHLGGVYLRQSKLDEAEASFKHAAELHQQAHDILGEGNDLHYLGAVQLRQFKLDEAEASLTRAIELHQQARSVLGEGNDLAKLGEAYLRRDKLDEAESSLKRAAKLHQQAYSVLGEGNDIRNLGEVHLRRDELDEAEASFKHAAELHQQAHDILGEGYDLQSLGGVYLRRSELDEAEASFKRAAELHRQAHSVLGEGNDLHELGEVHLRRDQLDEAEASFKRAAELHQLAHDVLSEGYDLQSLGQVHLRRSELDEAEASFKRAIELHQQTQDILGEGNDLVKLGEVYLRRDKLDEAEASFKQAIGFHQQAHNVLGEGNGLQKLGEVQLRRHNLEEAETSFQHAVKLHRQAHNIVGEGETLKILEEVHLQQSKMKKVEAPFKHDVKPPSVRDEAKGVLELGQGVAEFHRPAHSVLGDANDIQTTRDTVGNTPPRLGTVTTQNEVPSQNKPTPLTFRKKLAAWFSSCFK